MTPDVQAAVERVREYLEARRVMNAILRQEDTGTLDSCRNVSLRLADLRTLLAALDPAEQPIDHVPTEQGRATVNAYRAHRTQQPPRGGEET